MGNEKVRGFISGLRQSKSRRVLKIGGSNSRCCRWERPLTPIEDGSRGAAWGSRLLRRSKRRGGSIPIRRKELREIEARLVAKRFEGMSHSQHKVQVFRYLRRIDIFQ